MLHQIPIKNSLEMEMMRKVCDLTAQILDEVNDIIKPGISTEDINTFVHERTVSAGAVPSPLNYKGYPKSVCTSVNDVVCHGIPSKSDILKAGDIINVDVTCFLNGFHGDSSRMYFVGGRDACSAEAQKLVDITLEALTVGIAEVKPGAKTGNIGAAIQRLIRSTGYNYGIVVEYTGHGIGKGFHESPQIVHVGRKGMGDTLRPGMTFTIEPMINLGTEKTVLSKIDNWTVRTLDGALSAQWEHTVAVVPGGVEILTNSKLLR
jgi:methionyl aminopeptidase